MFIFPSAKFDINNLQDERAQLFGCDPDFNAWLNGKENVVGRPDKVSRCAGGHLHCGYDDFNDETNMLLIKALDLFISVPLVLMEPDNERKKMYGKAGSFRPQPWGKLN